MPTQTSKVEKLPLSAQARSTGYARDDYAHGKALGNCQRAGQTCRLYVVDDAVVWRAN